MRRMEKVVLRRWLGSVGPFLAPLARVADEFTGMTGVPVDLAAELFLRAGLAGYDLPDRTSANGSCRLLRAADDWVAVNLARPDDLDSVPALLALVSGPDRPPALDVADRDPWAALRTGVRDATAQEVAAAAQLLGMAAAAHGSDRSPRAAVRVDRVGAPSTRDLAGLRVVDFSALWAGPLCARLLGQAGARVVKVESTTRPDGTRSGSPEFYRWLHDGHESRVIDFEPDALAAVVADADVVVEASRPRALRRLGLRAEDFLAARPGRVWVSITGYGRDDDRIAFGDDAAVAAGLTGAGGDGPVFLGDAIADPVTGIHAAHAAARSLAAGGGDLIAVSMAGCAARLTAEAS